MFYRPFALLVLCFFLTGCADIQAPRPGEMLRQPTGSGGLHTGMTKAQVIERYGEPDIKSTVFSDEWKQAREEWVYRARYSALPVGAGYLANDLYLYFDGDNLTNISQKPLSLEEPEEPAESLK